MKSSQHWQRMKEPKWAKLEFLEPDYQDAYYYSAPKSFVYVPELLDEVDHKMLETYKKLGIPFAGAGNSGRG